MDKPKVSYTTKSGYTVTLDDPKKLVVKQGRKCIDGGTIKHNGQTVRLVVAYDDKPELAQQVAEWQAAWAEYQTGIAAEFDRNVLGLAELEAAKDAAHNERVRYNLAMQAMMDSEDGIAPKALDETIIANAKTLAAQYPRAAMYLRAKAYTHASNDRKYSAGKQAMALIASGGDLSDAQDILDNWSPGFTD